MEAFLRQLREGLCRAGLSADASQEERMARFYEMLEEANRSFNLTAIEGPEQAAERHFLDSLAQPALALLNPGDRVIDIGTGAGFPGMPLAILRPAVEFTLLDATRKRTAFLEDAAGRLGLDNVRVVHARVEDHARGDARESFQASTSRAVASLPVLMEYALPLLAVGGRALFWKGPAVSAELPAAQAACRILGGGDVNMHPYSLADRETFCIVEVQKIRQTPTKYPRKAGIPSKEPIK